MEIDFLRHFDFPPRLIDSLRTHYGESLLPLQEKAIHEGRLFDRNNLLICAPTSSGKTFLAEILFLFHALKGQNTILLVPTKALANQRYRQLQERYYPHGYDVVLSTRDHPFHDRRILDGHFHLAIVIYEKMRALLSQNSSFVSSLGACVVDEIHYLFHPTRGPDLEILLARLREESNLQILGLSAMVSDTRIAEWLHARLIVESKRPIELRQGVLCQGQFWFREFNSKKEGVEKFLYSQTADEGEAMLEAGRFFAAHGETTLLFWPLRDHCYTAARKLAAYYESEDDLTIPELDSLEPTAMCDFLRILLPRRIAIHTSDLSPTERDLIENLIRSGEVMLICATSTLAEGINFPVINVLTTKRMYASRPQDAQSGRPPTALPISQDRLLNMIGRAGRLGLSPYGRGIIVTASPGDVEGLLSFYMQSEALVSTPILNQIPFSQTLLKTMGYFGSFTQETCRQTLLDTLSGTLGLFPDSLDDLIDQTCHKLVEQGYLSKELETYYPTPLGSLVMKNGLSETSAQRITNYIHHHILDEFFILDEIAFVCTLREMDDVYLSISRNEIRSHTWSRAALRLSDRDGIGKEHFLPSLLADPARLRPEHHAAFKKLLIMHDWITGVSIPDLEKRYGIYSGLIYRLGEEISWLLGCMTEVVAANALEASWIDHLLELKERVHYGLCKNGLAWEPLLRKQVLSRGKTLALMQSGYETPSAIGERDKAFLSTLLSEEMIDILLRKSAEPETASHETNTITLVLDEGRPNVVTVDGTPIVLTPLQSKMVEILAHRVGTCVSYEELLQGMWSKSAGDKKQLSRLKTALLRKIKKITAETYPDLIESIKGRGLVLHAKIQRKMKP